MKKAISLLLSLVMVLSLALTAVGQWAVPTSAASVEDLTYTIENGEVTITGCSNAAAGQLDIPSTIEGYPVTAIGAKAFYSCASLTGIHIPESVVTIDPYAFQAQRQLRALEKVTVAEKNPAFSSDAQGILYDKDKTMVLRAPTKIVNCVLPSTVKTIGNYAFYYCQDMKKISLPEGLTTIGVSAFRGCTGVTSLNLPTTLTKIDVEAFYYMYFTNTVVIPEGITVLSKGVFASTLKFGSIYLPSTLTSIEENAFMYTSALHTVYFGGTEAQWENITINETQNDYLLTAAVIFMGDCQHTWDAGKVTEEADCSFYGTKTFTCSECDGVKIERIAPTGEHTYENGICTVCGAEGPNDVPPCHHTNTKVEGAKDATCSEAGYTGDTVCADCGELLTAGQEIPATGKHTYENGICTVCGAADSTPDTGDKAIFSVVLVAVMSFTAVAVLTKKRELV